MTKLAVIKAAGKQYLVKAGDEIIVDKLDEKENSQINLETLVSFDDEKTGLKLGTPTTGVKAKAKVLEHLRGDKINILKFKSKVRFAKRKGFRQELSKVKIVSI
ncbi:MAG: 50S ribosomal protein L21 [Patescibacteria group bacterium]